MKLLLRNDQLIDRSEAAISYLDRGNMFGDGVYEMIRVYGGVLFEPEAHYRRLEKSLREVRLEPPYPTEKLDAQLKRLIREEGLNKDGTIYMQITRGAAPRNHVFPAKAQPELIAYVSELERPYESMKQGIAVHTRPDIRWLRCDIKTLNLLPNVLAKQEALDMGVQDVIFHREGLVTESSSSNVFVVRDGTLYTHQANNLILHGITRMVVLQLAGELNIPCVEEEVNLDQLRGADEVFISSTSAEITPVVRVDGAAVGRGVPGAITRRLQEAFQGRIQALQ